MLEPGFQIHNDGKHRTYPLVLVVREFDPRLIFYGAENEVSDQN